MNGRLPEIALGLLLLLQGCARPPVQVAPGTTEGWEGYYPPGAVTEDWLKQKKIPLAAGPVQRVASRVAKLVIAGGSKQASAAELDRMHARYCAEPSVRAWNRRRCESLEARRCQAGRCSYAHFGNCSGLLLGGGRFLTAAHCLAELFADPRLADASELLVPGADGNPGRTLRLGPMVLGKHDFAHHWVALYEPGAVDAAVVTVDDGGLAPWPTAPMPARGEVVAMVGYPRAERRSAAARRAHGYDLVFGTQAVTFGRMLDPNPTGRPFCSTDGQQEHWTLADPCPAGQVGEGYRGTITAGAFETSTDTTNGLSGAPVLDSQGRLVGVNVTVAGGIDPQERYGSRAVGVSLAAAAARLGIAPLAGRPARPTLVLDTTGAEAWVACRKQHEKPATACVAASQRTTGGRIAELARSTFVSREGTPPDPAVEQVEQLVQQMRRWSLAEVAAGVAAYLPDPTEGRVQIFLVANGHPMGDAYVRSVRLGGSGPALDDGGEPVILLNALAIAAGYRGGAERQAATALGVVRHETFHALFARYRRRAPTWRRLSFSKPAQQLLLLVLNEGVAHFVDRRRSLMEQGFPPNRGERALERLDQALRQLARLPPGSAEARQIVGAAGEGPYWDKHGAISGMLMAHAVYRALGVPGIREALRHGPDRLVQLYLRAHKIFPQLPELPAALVQSSTARRP